MIPYYGGWKLRIGDIGITDSPYGSVYFIILQVKSNGRIFAKLIPTLSNKRLRKSIKRVIDLNCCWKLI